MKALVVEDDFICRKLLRELLSTYGECDIASNGEEAVDAFEYALENRDPYQLVCLDIMMPRMDGQEALRRIRALEQERGIYGDAEAKVLMISALDDPKTVIDAYYQGGATSFVAKPIVKESLLNELGAFGLL